MIIHKDLVVPWFDRMLLQLFDNNLDLLERIARPTFLPQITIAEVLPLVELMKEKHPPEIKAVLEAYKRQRQNGHSANCQDTICKALRAVLLKAGLWREVN